ncbi:MAG: transglycosylase SLT domain-containing protein [Candidatus Riflebacteria bacterium]|nr:transglycosylase SLT domain-containing protein [Candidatus Riflebacteria bacterium]
MKFFFILTITALLALLNPALTLSAETPFTEQAVKLEVASTSEMEAITRIVQPETHGFPVTGTIAGCGTLRMRMWPWGKVMTKYRGGTSLNVLGVSGEFYYVDINGQKGYMHRNYINLPNSPATFAAPYYPGDTRSGGYLPLNDGVAASKSSGSTTPRTTTSPATTSSPTSNTSGGNTPAPKIPGAPTGQAITTRSPEFKKCFDSAVSQWATQWAFPEVTNKYGRKVTNQEFMKAIIFIESSGVHRNSSGKLTTSHCGAMGFMQLMPATAKGLGVDATDPAQNLLGGAKFFKEVFSSRYVGQKSGVDKIVMAGCAYNMGPYSKKLAGSFEDMVRDRTGAVAYGLKVKMCLGLSLTDLERAYVKEKMAGSKGIDAYADQLYSYSHGLGA